MMKEVMGKIGIALVLFLIMESFAFAQISNRQWWDGLSPQGQINQDNQNI